jgi:intein/homing endonuclease
MMPHIKPAPYYRIRGRGRRLSIYSKKFYLFITSDIGIPGGTKKCTIGIPEKISSNYSFLKFFIRGLFDTDGSVFTSSKPGIQNYPTLEITSSNVKLSNDILTSLNKFGFRTHMRYAAKGSYKISIYGKTMLQKWFYEIGSSNPVKYRKLCSILECY